MATILFGASLDSPVAMSVARVAGVALLALVIACWRARHDVESRAAMGLVGAMVLYNVGVLAVLVYAGIGMGLTGLALWPVVVVHAIMATWCVRALGRPAFRAPA